MKLCNRCSVPGCCLDYLGTACKSARKEHCPNVKLNRAEYISNMDIDEMSTKFIDMFEELCEDGIPCTSFIKSWLREEMEDENFDIH